MKNDSLYIRLIHAYTLENLNKITYRIIDAYGNRNHIYIKNLARRVGRVEETYKLNRLFLRLITLYHPDKLAYYKKEIKILHNRSDIGSLKQFSHILRALEYVNNNEAILKERSLETEDQYEYDYKHYGNAFERNKAFDPADFRLWPVNDDRDFISALKHKEYGNYGVGYQEHDLSFMDEIELSSYNISDLAGIQQCHNLNLLDLSNNNISDINSISRLHFLEGIDLSYNEIIHIHALSELHNLHDIDLSFNHINDILSLLHLNNLKHLNITGNHISGDQIDEFRKKEIKIVF